MRPTHLDVFKSLNAAGAKYLVVGGFAVIRYGVPRLTKDLDIFIESTFENAQRVLEGLRQAGIGTAYLTDANNLLNQEIVILEDWFRVDILRVMKGMTFDATWKQRNLIELTDISVPFISLPDLIEAKQAAGRPRDIADVKLLEKILSGEFLPE